MTYFVYILFSEKLNKYYVGQTNNLEDRLKRHNSGQSKYTSKGMPWELTKYYICKSRVESVRLEQKIKKRGAKRYLLEN